MPDSAQPTLVTERLVLRPFRSADGPAVQRLAGAWEVADATLRIPHPYEDGMAEAWIGTHADGWARGEMVTFAITTPADGLIGAMSLRLELADQQAELGYWIGVPYWNRGFATEAAKAVLRFGLEDLDLDRIYATHLIRNPASGRVMAKAGMVFEETAPEPVVKAGVAEDLARYVISRGR